MVRGCWSVTRAPCAPGDVASRGGGHRHDPVIGLGIDQINRRFADGAIVALAFCAGLRRSEIAALRWRDGCSFTVELKRRRLEHEQALRDRQHRLVEGEEP